MSEFFLKFLNAIYNIIAPLFEFVFYIVLFIIALPIYIIALSCLCIVWLFMLLRFLLTKKDKE
jgi:phage-related protein